MMNPFFLTPEERVDHWKKFRNSLVDFPEETQMRMVCHYWADAPIMKCAYDSDHLEEWPGPWEMVMSGDWCRDSVAAGMEFTLRLAGWSADRMRLVMIRDYDISEQMLALKIDNKLLLNYSIGEVVTYPTTNHDVLVEFLYNGRGYTTK
jgi:hypothetical protein